MVHTGRHSDYACVVWCGTHAGTAMDGYLGCGGRSREKTGFGVNRAGKYGI